MKSTKIFMIITVLLSFTVCNAQTKNAKTESVKIYGNCGMCKSTIEKAGNVKKEATVNWNNDTKMATISYDSIKTSKEQILKRIALAGYDNENFLAPDDTYSSLPGCCQYERTKKTVAMTENPKMEIAAENSNHTIMTEAIQEENQLSKVFENYFSVKDALVKTDAEMTSTNAKSLLNTLNNVQMDKLPMNLHMVWMKVVKNLKEDTEHIADTKEISHQRDHFMTLSKNMYD